MKKIRYWIAQVFYELVKLFAPQKFPYGVIVGLHRVDDIDSSRLLINEGLKIAPTTLEKFIVDAIKKGYRFVSIDELIKIHNCNCKKEKVLCITLDDAYLDNYEKAWPIFRKHNVPFCIFVAPGLINDPSYCWWYALEEMILQNDSVQYDGREYPCQTTEEKENVFWTIRNQIAILNMTDLRSNLVGKCNLYDDANTNYSKNLFMNWKQLQNIAKDPLCTIGAHTYHHVAFAGCSFDELQQELDQCQTSITEHLGKQADIFAYPYGDKLCVKQEHKEWMHQQGYKAVLLAEGGGMGYTSDILQAPRFSIHNDCGAEKFLRSINRIMLRPIK